MINPLANIYNNPIDEVSGLKKQTLPYGGGSYNPAGSSEITPAPIFTGAPVQPSQVRMRQFTADKMAEMEEQPSVQGANYEKYKDPATGEVMSPEEYAIYLGNKVPKGAGGIPGYAGDVLTDPNRTENELIAEATRLNIARGDIAVGETDPYKVGSKSGIAYSPTELKAIENAYAGIYDPVLNDVFARLKDRKAEDAKALRREEQLEDRAFEKEMATFRTNESIRQWRATTGTTKTTTPDDIEFSDTQLTSGASNAGLPIDEFTTLDEDVQNFFIKKPMTLDALDNKVSVLSKFRTDMQSVKDGDMTVEDLTANITDGNLAPAVQHYFIAQIPMPPEEKEGWFSKIWSRFDSENPKKWLDYLSGK